jgi:cytidylate kinase
VAPQSFQVAIDGPVAVGKSTIARILAQRLGFLYVDTGAMYRATGLLAIREGVDPEDEEAVAHLLRQHNISLATPQGDKDDGRTITVYLDDEDVSWTIRTEETSQAASKVAQHKKVREQLVEQQQRIASKNNVVMEGRDITYRVLPEAQLKIYLTANEDQRATWRHTELLRRGQDVAFEDVKKELSDRDYRDMNRDVDPLQLVEDAWEFDRSDYDLEQAIDKIEEKARELWQMSEKNEK